MKINISLMRFSTVTDHHEIITKVVEADKIILEAKAKRFEINVKDVKDKNFFAYPNQFIRCLVITELNGEKTMQGYFTKISLYVDPNENFLGMVAIEEMFNREDVDRYFKEKYKQDKKAEKIDVQTISIEDFMIQTKISVMKEARMLFKRRKNVK